MTDVKELPIGVEENWTEPGLPAGRALNADIMPFSEFTAMHKRIGGRNALIPKTNFDTEVLDKLKANDEVMKAIEDDFIFSTHTMEPETIVFLKEAIGMFKPQVVLEVGAGLSTLILSKAQKDLVGNDTKYLTLEQDSEHLEAINKLAEKAGISKAFETLNIDLVRYRIGDEYALDEKAVPCFDFNEKDLHEALGGIKPDMIIVDGPYDEKSSFGASFAKTLVIPVLSQIASEQAVYFMTASYQDTEIFALTQAHESGAVNVIGVKAVGTGLGVALAPLKVEGTA